MRSPSVANKLPPPLEPADAWQRLGSLAGFMPHNRQNRHMGMRARSAGVAVVLGAVALVMAAMAAGHRLGQARALAALRVDLGHRIDLFGATAQGQIERLAHAPALLQMHPVVMGLFQEPRNAARQEEAKLLLRELNARQGSLAMFVADERGTVIATSHTVGADDGRQGEDISVRPYYLQALAGRPGRHFSVGSTVAEPGYYFSHPLYQGTRVVGVAVVKVSLAAVALSLPLLGTPAVLVDGNDVVIQATDPRWLYRAVRPLPLDTDVDLELSGMYGDRPLARFPLALQLDWDSRDGEAEQVIGPDSAASAAADPSSPQTPAGLLVRGRSLPGLDWRLLVLADLAPVRAQARVTAAVAALAAACLVAAALVLLQRRRAAQLRRQVQADLERLNAELEDTVARRTLALTTANTELRREMAVRVQAEATLRDAQDELVQAAKLAVLGQLSTGITHELAQPLGGIRTLAGNAREFIRRGDLEGAHGNLALVDTLVERMSGIIHPFKAFARKSPVAPEAVPITAALQSALFLLDQRLRAEQVQLQCRPALDAPAATVPQAWCNRNRLEQVMINLIGNAVDAMHGAPRRRLEIDAWEEDSREGRRVCLRIADSGPGLPPQVLSSLFTPFFTTKPAGSGLGLGLVISRGIAQDYGGDLVAASRAEGGAVFTLSLPAAPTSVAIATAPA